MGELLDLNMAVGSVRLGSVARRLTLRYRNYTGQSVSANQIKKALAGRGCQKWVLVLLKHDYLHRISAEFPIKGCSYCAME